MRYKKLIDAAIRGIEILPSRYRLRNGKETMASNPFFVFGSGRNGSTLLGTILNRNPDVFVAPEQYALPFTAIRFRLLNILGWRFLVRMVLKEYSRPENMRTPPTFSHLEASLFDLPRKERSLLSIVDQVNTHLAATRNRQPRIWGDKTPENTRKYQYLKPLIPGSKVVFVVRDGRDVVSSYTRANKNDFGIQTDPVVAANNWVHSIRVWEDLLLSIPMEDLLLIRYEELVDDPTNTVESLCRHIGVSFDAAILEPGESDAMEVGGLKDHLNTAKPVSTQSIGVWKKRLTEEQQRVVVPILHDDLLRMGYSVDS